MSLAELEYTPATGKDMVFTNFDYNFDKTILACYYADDGATAFTAYLVIEIITVEVEQLNPSIAVVYDSKVDTEFPEI
jgi:hypothetical protein